MGYRCEVTIMCEAKAFEMFKEAWESVDFMPDKIEEIKRTDIPSDYVMVWEWVKWYPSYRDVIAIEDVCAKLCNDEYTNADGYAFKKIIIGEDNMTEEVFNDKGLDELDMYCECYCARPDGIEITSQFRKEN